MNSNLKIGDKVTTVGLFPTVGIIKEFGYIPKNNNVQAFLKVEQFKDGLIAIDLAWNELKQL